MSDTNILQITPWVSAKDVDGMVRFFVDVLGFHAWVHAWDYAYLQRGSAAVRVGKMSDGPAERCEVGPRAFRFYLDVKDVAALAQELTPKLLAAGLPAGQGPVDQTWGQREFRVPMPEGGLIIFGEEIAPGPDPTASAKQEPTVAANSRKQ